MMDEETPTIDGYSVASNQLPSRVSFMLLYSMPPTENFTAGVDTTVKP